MVSTKTLNPKALLPPSRKEHINTFLMSIKGHSSRNEPDPPQGETCAASEDNDLQDKERGLLEAGWNLLLPIKGASQPSLHFQGQQLWVGGMIKFAGKNAARDLQ